MKPHTMMITEGEPAEAVLSVHCECKLGFHSRLDTQCQRWSIATYSRSSIIANGHPVAN